MSPHSGEIVIPPTYINERQFKILLRVQYIQEIYDFQWIEIYILKGLSPHRGAIVVPPKYINEGQFKILLRELYIEEICDF